MRWSAHSSRTSLVVVVVLVLLLAVLATLQYRWIAQLSEAERARLERGLDQAVAGFCKDFDREVARAFALFALEQPADDTKLTELLDDRLTEWRSTAIWPGLVQSLSVIRLHDSGEISGLCFDERSKNLDPCNPGEEHMSIRRPRNSGRRVPVIDGDLPGLVIAIEGSVSPTEQPPEWRPPRDHLIVRLDLDHISKTILPRLAETHFGADGEIPYLLRVASVDRQGGIIFQTNPQVPSETTRPDVSERLFGLRAFPGYFGPPHGDPGMRGPRPPRDRQDHPPGYPPQSPPPPGMNPRTEDGHWILSARHPAGSLEIVVAQARRRNMAISLAILAMLGVTSTLMVLSTRRARLLARQQMDFVAAVSHELRTPLTAMRSAGQNLADGIVDDPEKVKNYGLLIEREGRRLTEMIGRVLTFAGIRSGRQIYRMEPVDVGDIVRAALEDGNWVLSESGFEVSTEIADGLPRVKGDKVALRQVVANLIDNALKYAADGRWLDLQVGFESGPGAGEVWVSVADHGPGIPRREMATIFEPFHRGADAGSSIPGSGLGLAMVRSIVKAHGGDIEVTSSSPGGTVFTVRLPAVREQVTERGEQR